MAILETRVRRFFLPAAVALIALVCAGVAAAHVIDAATKLTIDRVPGGKVDPGKRVVVFGKLRSSAAVCRRREVVQLRRQRAGADEVLARDTTDAEGEYRFAIRPRETMVVYARFAGSLESSYGHEHRCRGDDSRAMRIKVR